MLGIAGSTCKLPPPKAPGKSHSSAEIVDFDILLVGTNAELSSIDVQVAATFRIYVR